MMLYLLTVPDLHRPACASSIACVNTYMFLFRAHDIYIIMLLPVDVCILYALQSVSPENGIGPPMKHVTLALILLFTVSPIH